MFARTDRTKIDSLVIFSDIIPLYRFGDDIECRFYVDPSLNCDFDKIGLYRVGWSDRKDFRVIKDVIRCATDEFDERKLIFPANELKVDVEHDYQFCYFHRFQTAQTYQLSGRSQSFRFYKSVMKEDSNETQLPDVVEPNAPEYSALYPVLNVQQMRADINQTVPKRVYDMTDRHIIKDNAKSDRNSDQKSKKSVHYRLAPHEIDAQEVEHRYIEQIRIKDVEIDKLKTCCELSEEKLSSLEYELEDKQKNEESFERIQNELMVTIRLCETKNSSLEEQLLMRDLDINKLKKKCSEQEKLINELTSKLTISQSELDLYQTQTIDALDEEQSVLREQEISVLRDKLRKALDFNEMFEKRYECLERAKRDSDKTKLKYELELQYIRQNCEELKTRLEKSEEDRVELRAQLRAKDIMKSSDEMSYSSRIQSLENSFNSNLIADSRRMDTTITIYANEMTEEVKNYCINQTTKALKLYNDIKSIAESIVSSFDEMYGNSWHCFIGDNFAHNSLLHVFGTYISLAISDIKIVLYKTSDSLDSCQVLKSAKETKKVDIIRKNEFIDKAFERVVTSLALEAIDEEFVNYTELAAHLTQSLNEKYGSRYGYNWLSICGECEQLDTNLLITNKKYRYIELRIDCLTVIVMQFDQNIRTDYTKSVYRTKSIRN